jgi:phosphonate transport system ATP-binding protein
MVMDDFKRINKEMNISVIMNIHHVEVALEYADRVIGIRKGEVVFDGPSRQVTKEVLDEIYGGKLEDMNPSSEEHTAHV